MLRWAQDLTSGQLFIIYAAIMLLAFGLSIKWPAAPILAFASNFTLGFSAALVNRYYKNKSEVALNMADTAYCAPGGK
jgi:hypothetical protein